MASRRSKRTPGGRNGTTMSSSSTTGTGAPDPMPVMEDSPYGGVPDHYMHMQELTPSLRDVTSYYAQGQTNAQQYMPAATSRDMLSNAAPGAHIHVIDKEFQKQFRGRMTGQTNAKIHWMENKKSQVMGICWTMACLGLTLAFYNYRWAGLIAGSVNTIVCGLAVVVTYSQKREWHQHPNPIVHMRSCLSIFLAICLLLNVYVDYDPNPLHASSNSSIKACKNLAGLTEFFFFSSEAWGLVMAIDLLSSLNDPFKSYKRSMKFYHAFVWTASLVMGIITFTAQIEGLDAGGFFQVDGRAVNTTAPTSQLIGFCLASSRNEPNKTDTISKANGTSNGNENGFFRIQTWPWILLYGFVIFVLIVSLVVLLIAWRRLYSGGVPKTYNLRLRVLNYISLFTGALVFYWLFLLFLYMSTYFVTNSANEKDDLAPMVLKQFFTFLIASKGYLEYIIWFAVNNVQKTRGKNHTSDVDVDLSPQVNLALRSEILYYTTSGIKQSVHEVGNGSNTSEMFLLNDGSDEKHNKTIKFWSYAPTTFRAIRETYGIDDHEYTNLFSATTKERFSEGRSGAFMFYTSDESFIVKTMSREECDLLRRMAPRYANYLVSHPQSLLTKFYGCHAVLLYGKMYYFVVMGNLFANTQVIHHRYDIKGSWEDRNAAMPKVGGKVTCRYCNARYTFGSTKSQECGDGLNYHEPNIVLKDNDLMTKVRIDPRAAEQLYDQICFDSDFLYEQGIMDYSLLMGVQSCEYYVEPGIVGGMNLNGIQPTSVFATQMATSVNGPALYQFGIIDFLQQWTFEKKFERFYKRYVKRKDPDGISAMPPKQYKLRFQQKMSQVFAISKGMANAFVGQQPIWLDVLDQGVTSSTRNRRENGTTFNQYAVDEANLRHTTAMVLSDNERDTRHVIP
ncbi:phosphatidylinositol-4-phosphate-5-kinase (Pi-PIPKD5), partial [Thraustotheca clavata]